MCWETNTDHYNWRIFLCSTCCRVQDGNDVVRRSIGMPRWNSDDTVWRSIQRYIMPACFLWRRHEQRLAFHYQLTCTVQHNTHNDNSRPSITVYRPQLQAVVSVKHVNTISDSDTHAHQLVAASASVASCSLIGLPSWTQDCSTVFF